MVRRRSIGVTGDSPTCVIVAGVVCEYRAVLAGGDSALAIGVAGNAWRT
jgi:hypothetical protein